ncbi:MipA/OmpV family protein [uncultured Paracoccus sp.]|uniref:MipA/OmpV family protein n=1 Tax=uncultured Paracoccus sp. TaxID=189685 RepID=UPI00260AD386|nr:MipA/OmpV family protein [uncultured Paracoccus sp.]
MTNLLPMSAILLAASVMAAPAQAQDGWGFAADVGLGADYGPDWMGSDERDASPWVIFRNVDLTRPGQALTRDGSADGLAISPSFAYRAARDADDSPALAGLPDIDAAGELGAQLKYSLGNGFGYVAARKGFGGHEGIVGEVGAKYRFSPSERLTLWAGAEAGFGNEEFVDRYFGVASADPLVPGHAPDGGIYSHALSLEGRYALTDSLAVLGEARYTELTGDAADAPFIQDTAQPSVRLGLVHRFNFRF